MNKLNAEGYADPTAHIAIINAMIDNRIDLEASRIMVGLKNNLEFSGFELVGEIKIRHIKSGREYR